MQVVYSTGGKGDKSFNDATFRGLQKDAHIEKMRQLTNCRRESDLATTLLIDHTLYHIEADLQLGG